MNDYMEHMYVVSQPHSSLPILIKVLICLECGSMVHPDQRFRHTSWHGAGR